MTGKWQRLIQALSKQHAMETAGRRKPWDRPFPTACASEGGDPGNDHVAVWRQQTSGHSSG